MIGKDVVAALGYTNPQKAIQDHVAEDGKGVNEIGTPHPKLYSVLKQDAVGAVVEDKGVVDLMTPGGGKSPPFEIRVSFTIRSSSLQVPILGTW